MRLLARLFLWALGLLFAVPAGAVALFVGALIEPTARELLAQGGLSLLDGLLGEFSEDGAPEAYTAAVMLGLWTLAIALVVAPPALTGLVGEVIGTRSFAWYGGACGLLTALLPWILRPGGTATGLAGAEGRLTALLFVTGAVAGLTYWAIAGRSAGRERTPPLPAPGWERGRG